MQSCYNTIDYILHATVALGNFNDATKCHAYCPNGESVPPSVSKPEQTLPTRGSLQPLPHLGGETTSLEQKITFFFPPTDRPGEK